MSYIHVSYLVRTISIVLLLLIPLRDHFRISRKATVVLVSVLSVIGMMLAVVVVTRQPSDSRWRLLFSLSSSIVMIVGFSAILKLRPGKVLFILLVIKGFSDDVAFLADILVLSTDRADIPGGSAPEQVFLYAATFFPMYFFIRKLICPLLDLKGERPFWRFLWLIPCAFYFVYRIGVNPAYLGDVISNPGDTLLLFFAWTVAMFLTYFVILRMLADTARVADLQERLRVSELQIRMQNDAYALIKERMETTRRMRHDLRHHLLAIKGYAVLRDSEAILSYVDSCLNSVKEKEPANLCANYAVNAILCHYLSFVRENGTELDTDLSLPEQLPMEESDVCIVMGNLIENAAESCIRQARGRRFIRIRAALAGEGMLAITVSNSYSGEINMQDGIFLSSKRAGKGYGVESVRCIVEQCHGVAKFSFTHDVFTASVLMSPCEERITGKILV